MANSSDTADSQFLDVFERIADFVRYCIKALFTGKTSNSQRLLRVGQHRLSDMANMAE